MKKVLTEKELEEKYKHINNGYGWLGSKWHIVNCCLKRKHDWRPDWKLGEKSYTSKRRRCHDCEKVKYT